jgi:YjbE family integral membrane protein
LESLYGAEFWGRLLEIGFLNLLLSGDNAIVIALAVRLLPQRERVLGQIWGTVGAVALRLVFLGVVSALLRVPLLRIAGGALLVWIAIRLVRPPQESKGRVRHGTSIWEAVWIIIVADVTMSLDNVLAVAAAARGDMLLLGVGIATSLPLVVWGSGLLASLMERHRWIIWVGGGILGYVAGEMILGEPTLTAWLGPRARPLTYAVSLALAGLVAGCGWWPERGRRHPRQGRSESAARRRPQDGR